MNRLRRTVVLIISFVLLTPLFAEGHVGIPFDILRVASADSPGRESLNWKIHSTYYTQRFRPGPGRHLTEERTTASVGVGYMLTDHLGVGLSSELARSAGDTSTTWTGSVNLGAKAHLFGTSTLKIGVILLSSVPVYSSGAGGESVAIAPEVVVTMNPGDHKPLLPYRIHLNLGYSLTADGDKLDDVLLCGVGVELAGQRFTPFMEFTAELLVNDSSSSLRESPARLTPGLKWAILDATILRFGLDLSVSKPPLQGLKTVEDWKVVLGVSKF